MAFCANCGATLSEGTRFCAQCGQAAGAAPASPAAAPAPPGAASAGAAPGAAPAGVAAAGLPQNIAAGLTYVLGFITGVVFLVLEPYSRDSLIRFHAFQSIFYSIAAIIISTVVGAIPFIGLFLWYPVWLALTAGWVALLVMAFTGKKWKLPVIGDWAEKQA